MTSATASETAIEHRRGILAVLGRLALHPFARQNLSESQAKLVMEDMIRDLERFSLEQISGACEVWRKSDEAFFPRSGQLIAIIEERTEASISTARALRPPFRMSPELVYGDTPRLFKPASQILAERGAKMLEHRKPDLVPLPNCAREETPDTLRELSEIVERRARGDGRV